MEHGANSSIADKREFIQISRAVGVGFIVMGALGYIIKLSTYNSHSTEQSFQRALQRLAVCEQRLEHQLTPHLVHIPVNNILVGGA